MDEMCLGMFISSTICLFLILTIFGECQTLIKTIPNCFGINAQRHESEVLPFQSGTAYHLSSPAEGISLSYAENKTTVQGCAYAFSISPGYKLTIFIQKAEVKWKHETGDSVQILFIGDQEPSKPMSKLSFSSRKSDVHNLYLNTNKWLDKTNVIFMFINYTRNGTLDNRANLYIKLTITPTYTCLLSNAMSRGEYTYVRNILNPGWRYVSDMFHPGWVLCADTVRNGNSWFAPCIDYRLTCDRKFNCPSDHGITNANNSVKAMELLYYPSDEHAKKLVCFSPSLNWIILLITIFTILNVILLITISYIGIVRHYSPLRFIRLQSQCLMCFCCCFPSQYIAAITGNHYFVNTFRRTSTNVSVTTELPTSPPIYDNVQATLAVSDERSYCCWCCKNRDHGSTFAESGHNLPPSYSDSSENIGILPDGILAKIKSLQKNGHTKLQDRANASITRLKPAPQRSVRSAYSLREELRVTLRQIINRLRALCLCCLNAFRLCFNHQHINRVHPGPTTDNANQPLPTYGDFISGDFSSVQTVVVVESQEDPAMLSQMHVIQVPNRLPPNEIHQD